MEKSILIVSACEAERKKIILYFRNKWAPQLVSPYECGQFSLPDLIHELQSPDLFAQSPLYLLDKVEQLKKEECQELCRVIAQIPALQLILSGTGFKGDTKGFIVYDFTKEKPWEREARLKQWLQDRAKEESKLLSSQSATCLVERVSSDYGVLEQELTKLITYIGERSTIELSDIKALSPALIEPTGWQVAEALVWDRKSLPNEPAFDLSLIGQVRYHLQLGQQIVSLLRASATTQEILAAVPNLRPKALDKYLPLIKARAESYFSQGLQALFRCEVACKSSSVSPHIHWTRFKAEIL